MACRRAADIDLAAFLEDPPDPALAQFRAHYPDCPDCAREVRAWNALQARLREGAVGPNGAHPSEEQLLTFEERPHELQPDTRRLVEEHLALCRSCRDELGALRTFEFSPRTAARAPTPPWRAAATGMLGRLRALVLHPAFAYGLVLLLLVPTILQQIRPPRPSPPMQPRSDRPADEGRAEQVVGPPNRVVREAAPAPKPLLGTPGREAMQEPPGEGAGRQRAEAPAVSTEWRTLTLGLPVMHFAVGGGGGGEPAPVALTDVAMGVVLRVVLPRGVEGPTEIEVLSPDGAREMRERFATGTSGSAGSAVVNMRIPASWLTPGRYQVVMRTGGAADQSREVGRLFFEIH